MQADEFIPVEDAQLRLRPVRERYLERVALEYAQEVVEIRRDLEAPPRPLVPVPVQDASALSGPERQEIVRQYSGTAGVAAFLALSWQATERHPLLSLLDQLKDQLPTKWLIDHPMETHSEAVARFGTPDGTLKIYDLPVEVAGPRYREQAETNEAFDAHNDGLGYAGLVSLAALWLDAPPAWGGYTYFANVVRASRVLAHDDPEAFSSLFLPDAITCTRPRGKGAIRVTAPVLYLGENGDPRCFLRVASGEYQIEWRSDHAAINRARRWCEGLVEPFSAGTTFAHMMTIGEGVLIRNQHVVHGRTPFIDSPGTARRLARKWCVTRPEYMKYRHAPALEADETYSDLFPEIFSSETTSGDWHFDQLLGMNRRIDEAGAS